MLGLSDPSWGAWILNAGDRPIGLALVRARNQPAHVLNCFFSSSPHGAVDSACNSLAPRSTPTPARGRSPSKTPTSPRHSSGRSSPLDSIPTEHWNTDQFPAGPTCPRRVGHLHNSPAQPFMITQQRCVEAAGVGTRHATRMTEPSRTVRGIERCSACRPGRRNVLLMRLSGLVSHRRQEDVHDQR